MTYPPASVTHSSIVSCDSVKIYYAIVDLNGLDILESDIGNTYLNTPCHEKIYFTAGAESGNRKGASLVVVCVLYRLKSIGAAWRAHCDETIMDMDFITLEDDPGVWI